MEDDELIASLIINNNSYFEYPDGTKVHIKDAINQTCLDSMQEQNRNNIKT